VLALPERELALPLRALPLLLRDLPAGAPRRDEPLPLLVLRLLDPLRDGVRDAADVRRERADALAEVRRERDVRRERPESARWSRGISALTSAFTSRVNSASRNFAMRSSSRRIDLASCAVSRSPTSLARVSIRL
jgi:hypothetical protein